MATEAPYGSWRSPIASEMAAGAAVSLGSVALDGADVYWIEGRPAERGRNVVVRLSPGGAPEDLTPEPFNARSRVHEYGGGAATVADGAVYFSSYADGRIWRQDGPGAPPVPLTPEGPWRHADLVVDARRERLLCVREDHSAAAPGREPRNEIVAVPLPGGGAPRVVASGADFYAAPRLAPDGERLAWLQWNHPDMPWDGCELRCDGARVAGGPGESVTEPAFAPDGALHFASDRSDFWNLYLLAPGATGPAEPLAPRRAEFSVPLWNFGVSTFDLLAGGRRIVCAFKENGRWNLGVIDLDRPGALRPIETPFTEISSLRAAPGGQVVFRGASPTEPPSIVRLDLASGTFEILRRAMLINVDQHHLSAPEPIEVPRGLFYAPKNGEFRGPAAERPPLIVLCHGGPTSCARAELDLRKQYFTSRGFALLDVDYGGSTGYGREYRRRLEGRWGEVDVADAAAGARHLAARGLVDGHRMAISGGSAGGFTALAALAFDGTFAAGASYYGISDLEALARDTHKFEARYTDRLIGPYPERADLYRARSPIHAVERMSRPAIFFQGLEDAVVPPSQSERMVEALRAKGVAAEYVAFEGEQHGFRKASSIRTALERELAFYGRVFGFSPCA